MAAKKLISVLLLAVAINIVVAGTISVYVSDSTGSDSTGDGSMESPFKTIGKAKDHVRTLDKTDGDSKWIRYKNLYC
jgi:FlaG/FlaF family flagellin (archaellin)